MTFATVQSFAELRMSPSAADSVARLKDFVGKSASKQPPYPFQDVPLFYKSLTERAALKGKQGKPMPDSGYHYLSSEAPGLLKSFRVGLSS